MAILRLESLGVFAGLRHSVSYLEKFEKIVDNKENMENNKEMIILPLKTTTDPQKSQKTPNNFQRFFMI